jgi:hypothetical protein
MLALLPSACVDVGQQEVSLPLTVRGNQAAKAQQVGAWDLELTRAELAFGPLYLCAGYQAGALCDTARLEWLDAAVVDLLDDEAREVGTLQGSSGEVRSNMYDLGFISLLTQTDSVALSAAESLGGMSVVFEGTAHKQTDSIPFVIEMPLTQETGTERGVSLVRSSRSDRISHDVTGKERALEVHFDPAGWFSHLELDALPGNTELRSTGIESQAGRALRTAILAGKRPVFTWVQ